MYVVLLYTRTHKHTDSREVTTDVTEPDQASGIFRSRLAGFSHTQLFPSHFTCTVNSLR